MIPNRLDELFFALTLSSPPSREHLRFFSREAHNFAALIEVQGKKTPKASNQLLFHREEKKNEE